MPDFGWHYPPGAANDPRAPYSAAASNVSIHVECVATLADGDDIDEITRRIRDAIADALNGAYHHLSIESEILD